jgi:acetyltransferase-like isoleucine patch superfamily enzyme
VLRDVHIGRGVTITVGAGASMVVGADYVGPNCVLVARESVAIGDGTKIAEMVVVRDADHDHSTSLRNLRFVTTPVTIGADVWLGARAVVLRGVAVGDHATVGAGAVVTRSVGAHTTVVGVPAREVSRGARAGEGPPAAPPG